MERRVVILLGPTAVGKTDISIKLAKILDTEIISSDSMQIYKYMDIGTAKPSLQQRKEVVHHMIDIINPWDYFSAGNYAEMVSKIIENLFNKGKIPLIVGGTGLYLMTLTKGIFEGPNADWELRKRLLEKEFEKPGTLYGLLKEIDPKKAEKIFSSDLRRIIRALEVFYKEKRLMSEMQNKLTRPLPYEFIKIGLIRERKELYSIIEERVDKMISLGLIEEVRRVLSLIKRNAYSTNPFPALQAIGYKEIAGYLADLYTLDEAIRLIKKRTRNYAKRQLTWFKQEKDIIWFDISKRQDFGIIADQIYSCLSKILNKS